jgi:hypothetical protein
VPDHGHQNACHFIDDHISWILPFGQTEVPDAENCKGHRTEDGEGVAEEGREPIEKETA